MSTVYILQSLINNRFYIGCTNNLVSRINEHNRGYVKSTKAYIPWKLVYQEKFDKLSQARKREHQIKSWKKRKSIERLINMAPSSIGLGH